MSIDEEIAATKALTIEDLKAFHKEFYGASSGEVAVVGELDEKEISGILAREFGSWKSATHYARIPRPFSPVSPVIRTIEVPDKSSAVFIARMNIRMSDTDQDYPAFELANFILGGGFLNSRLATRIRHKDGLSYGVGSDVSAGIFEPSGAFYGSASFAPENAEKLEAAFKEEIEKALTQGFSDDEVENAKAGYLLDRQRSRGSDSRIASILADRFETGRTLDWDQSFESKIQSLTTGQVNEALRKYLKFESLSIVKAGSFKGKSGN